MSQLVPTNWNVGRGKQCGVKIKEVLLMTLTVLKSGGQGDFLRLVFNINGPTIERMIGGFIRAIIWIL